MDPQNIHPVYPIGGSLAVLAIIIGSVAYGNANADKGPEKVEDPNVECMLDDSSAHCTDLYSRSVAEAGRFDDAVRFFIHGGGYDAMRDNDSTLAVIEENGLVQCFTVKADSTGSIQEPVATLNSDNYRPNYTSEDVPNHLALVYDNAARGMYAFGDKPEEVTAFVYAKDEDACRSFPNSWSVDGLVYNNL